MGSLNDSNVPDWMGQRSGACRPPDTNFKVFQNSDLDDSDNSTTGEGCLGTIFGTIAFCAVCVFGTSNLPASKVSQSQSVTKNTTFASFCAPLLSSAKFCSNRFFIPTEVLLAEAWLVTGGVAPADNDYFGDGPQKSIYSAFVSHARFCSRRLGGSVPSNSADYLDSALSAKLYTPEGYKLLLDFLPTAKYSILND